MGEFLFLPDLNLTPPILVDLIPDLNLTPSIDLNLTPSILVDLNMEPDLEMESEDDFNMDEIPTNEDTFEELLNHPPSQVQRNVLTNDQRKSIYNMLLQNGKLKKGTTSLVASQFSVSIRTIQHIWKQSKNDETRANVSHKRTKNCGRKRIEINLDQVRDIPLSQRTTLASLSYALNMKKTTLFRRLKSGCLRRHSNAIKPFFKEENKIARLRFCISMLDVTSIPHDPIFVNMYNVVHIDEKWFYLTKKSENYYLLPDEEDPIRTCKSKSFIGKVMFLVAIARPRFDIQGTKAITSVKREIVRSCLIEKVLPAIKEKWPKDDSRYTIYVQQNNARTHIDPNDSKFCDAARQDGFDIRLRCQPPNSPDLNVLDLGFFSAIQSLQYKESPKSTDELINAVVNSFEAFSTIKSNRIFLTMQLCMIEIMRAKGSNKYKIPHVKKAMLERANQLPIQWKCDPILVQEIMNMIN